MRAIRLHKTSSSGAPGSLAMQSQIVPSQQATALPMEWLTAAFGPGLPMQPLSRPVNEMITPREIDYPISVNATLQPRIGYGLMPFSTLKSAYDNVTEVSLPVLTIVRELMGFRPRLVDEDSNEIFDHPYAWLTVSPDRELPHDVWLTRLVKNALIYDTGALHIQESHGELVALDYLDGSTLMLIINEQGRMPRPDEVSEDKSVQARYITKAQEWISVGKELPRTTPAFAQVIHGVPFAWWDQDQVWYRPRSRTVDTPYGESFIERGFTWVNVVANVAGFELAHYRTGNMPEGWAEAPVGWTSDRIALWENTFNARMSSGPAERMRVRFLPAGFVFHETKRPQFPRDLYDQARDNIALLLGLPPSEFGKVPGQGLGGKGFGEAMESALFRNALMPIKTFVEDGINEMLKRYGVDDVSYELTLPTMDVDPEKQKESIKDLFAAGILTLNDALGQLGLDEVEGGDIHIVVSGGSVIVLEDYLKHPNSMTSTSQTGTTNPTPAHTEPTPTSPSDFQTAERILQTAAHDGRMSTTTHSLPSRSSTNNSAQKLDNPLKHPHDHQHRFAPKGTIDTAAARRIGRELGINFAVVDTEQFRLGLEQEQARAVTATVDIGEIGRLVLSHLQDDPAYYKGQFNKKGARPGIPPGFKAELLDAGVVEDEILGVWWNTESNEIFASVGDWASTASRAGLRQVFGGNILIEAEATPPLDDPHWVELDKLVTTGNLDKHCGVCPEDDEYFGAPISREVTLPLPISGHANEVEIVAMVPEGLPPKPGLWKPEGGEEQGLRIGVDHEYPREEAAYLLDRALGFYLVPVAYVAEADDGEVGAVVYYAMGAGEPYGDVNEYAPEWIEKAAVLDYIMSQTDRGYKHNYLTHPDDPSRPILIDNGLAFPFDDGTYCDSPFCQAWMNQALSDEVVGAIMLCLGDAATWKDIRNLVGSAATQKAILCAKRLVSERAITLYEHSTASGGS